MLKKTSRRLYIIYFHFQKSWIKLHLLYIPYLRSKVSQFGEIFSFFKTLARNWRSTKSVDPGYKNFDYNTVTSLVLFTLHLKLFQLKRVILKFPL